MCSLEKSELGVKEKNERASLTRNTRLAQNEVSIPHVKVLHILGMVFQTGGAGLAAAQKFQEADTEIFAPRSHRARDKFGDHLGTHHEQDHVWDPVSGTQKQLAQEAEHTHRNAARF